jgi:organic radical activating enzyme
MSVPENIFIEYLKPLKVVVPCTLTWMITRACNLRCRYCVQKKQAYREIDHKEVLQRIIRLAPKHLVIGGGEPTLVPQLPQIAAALKRALAVRIAVNTNLTDPDALHAALPWINDVIVSFDTVDPVLSAEYRGVEPDAILRRIAELVAIKKRHGYHFNITVNSVVAREMLAGDGIDQLNARLHDIDPAIQHLFCPIFPQTREDSIVNDDAATRAFFQIACSIREKGRNIKATFPAVAGRTFYRRKDECYYRFFRLKLVEDGPFASPCPPGDIGSTACDTPCNCALFLEPIVTFSDEEEIRNSFLHGLFSAAEVSRMKEFHRRFLGKDFPDSRYAYLLRNSGKNQQECLRSS